MVPDSGTFWLRKLASPTGFALSMLLLFMPFVGVACESGMGKVEAEISGWDMVVGGEPSVSTSGIFASEEPTGSDPRQERTVKQEDEIPTQPLMVFAVLVITAAVVLGLALPTPFARAMGGLTAALVVIMALGVNEIVMIDLLVDEVGRSSDITASGATEMVGSRLGFWLTLLLVVATLGYNVVELALNQRRRSQPYRQPGRPPQPWMPTEQGWHNPHQGPS